MRETEDQVNENQSESDAITEPGEQESSQGESAPAETTSVIEEPGAEEIAFLSRVEEAEQDIRAAIFDAGQEAGEGGLDATHCPYSQGDERGDVWRRGHGVGRDMRPPDKPMAAAAEIDEAARIPDRFRSLVVGRMVYYAERVNQDQISELAAIVAGVVNQAEGLVNLWVFRNDPSLVFKKNVSYEPSGDVRKTWRWPQGE